MEKAKFNTPEELIEEIRQGHMVILVDDEDRENEGDLVLAADYVTPIAINFMAKEARGLICLALASEQIDRLQIPLMVRDEYNFTPNKTAFTVSIEASSGVSTGISAADRAHTIKVASNPHAKASDIHTPGHIFPIRAQHGGVLKRAGHTEGSVDLAKLAGLNPAAVICEVMNEDGTMSRVPDLLHFAKKHKIKIGTIVDLMEYRLKNETLVEEVMGIDLPLNGFSNFKVRVFKSRIDGIEHLVLQKGEIHPGKSTLVRVHAESLTRDLFGGLRFGEHPIIHALKIIDRHDSGVFLLLRDSSRSSLLSAEIDALVQKSKAEGENVLNANKMDGRDYGIGAQILRTLGVRDIRLITNHAEKRVGLKAYDLEIVDYVPFTGGVVERENNEEASHRRGHGTLQ